MGIMNDPEFAVGGHSSAQAMTAGTAYPPGRAVGIVATVAGNVEFLLADGVSTIVVPVATGWALFPFAATTVVSAGTTATATFYSLT
jgi:hypothetical protein